MQPHRRQPTRLPRPWDSPGKNTGVRCHFLLQCMKVKSESEVYQLRPHGLQPTRLLCPWDFPGKRVLEWGAIATLPKYFLFPTFPFLQTFLRKVSYFLAASCLLRLRHLALITVMTAGTMAGLTECLLCTRLSAYCLAHVISVNYSLDSLACHLCHLLICASIICEIIYLVLVQCFFYVRPISKS